jgi:hypothetical protein
MFQRIKLLPSSALKMEFVSFSETLVFTYGSTRRQQPEEYHRLVKFIYYFGIFQEVVIKSTKFQSG